VEHTSPREAANADDHDLCKEPLRKAPGPHPSPATGNVRRAKVSALTDINVSFRLTNLFTQIEYALGQYQFFLMNAGIEINAVYERFVAIFAFMLSNF